MSFNRDQFKNLINRVLCFINLDSVEATDLLLGTCAVESRFGTYLKQVQGPALGVFQIEPTTLTGIWENFLNYREDLSEKIKQVSGVGEPSLLDCEANLVYQICMARVFYLRKPMALPSTLDGQARYWKKYYNTHLGRGTVIKYIESFNLYCGE
jgi:hypothetical protein